MQIELLEKAGLHPQKSSEFSIALLTESTTYDKTPSVSWKHMVLVRLPGACVMSSSLIENLTGTSLGDLIEIQGINEVFKSSHTPDAPLVVGASKTCVGHTELIAGLIGVLKTIGTLNNGKVPGLVQLTENNMNPSLDCSVVPLHIPHENVILKQNPNRPLRALVLYVLFILLFHWRN
jgi:hypothetical protein